jgi:hypothetical protein
VDKYGFIRTNTDKQNIKKPLKILAFSAFSRVFTLAQREGFEHSKNVGITMLLTLFD